MAKTAKGTRTKAAATAVVQTDFGVIKQSPGSIHGGGRMAASCYAAAYGL